METCFFLKCIEQLYLSLNVFLLFKEALSSVFKG